MNDHRWHVRIVLSIGALMLGGGAVLLWHIAATWGPVAFFGAGAIGVVLTGLALVAHALAVLLRERYAGGSDYDPPTLKPTARRWDATAPRDDRMTR